MRNKHLFPLGMALLLLAGHGARADRPLVSETADALPAGQCQVETGLARLSASGTPAATAIDAAAPCGVAGHSQLGIGVGAVRQASAANQKAAGRGRRHDSTRLAGVATKELT